MLEKDYLHSDCIIFQHIFSLELHGILGGTVLHGAPPRFLAISVI